MARGVNKVILVGNVGQDPEIRSTQGGVEVATLSIATNESWTDKQTGEKKQRTEWHRVVFFAGVAGVIRQYVKAGQQLYIEGQIRTRQWEDENGQKRYMTEIVGRDMQMLGGGGQGQQGGAQNNGGAPAQSQPPQNQPPAGVDFDDDVPF